MSTELLFVFYYILSLLVFLYSGFCTCICNAYVVSSGQLSPIFYSLLLIIFYKWVFLFDCIYVKHTELPLCKKQQLAIAVYPKVNATDVKPYVKCLSHI